jgi:chemotaxis protein MotA
MLAILGILIVFGAVIGGFMLENGPVQVLYQPAEFSIIFGSLLGAFCIGSSRAMLGQVLRSVRLVLSMRHYDKATYLELLSLLSVLFTKIRREGVSSVEIDIEHPDRSLLFDTHPRLSADTEVVRFICDTMRVFMTTGDQLEVERLMKNDMEVMLDQAQGTAEMLSRMAESLPGLGIVAAVLGVILTMGQISAPPEILGHSIGAALVGTFLGVLFCYGVVGPMSIKLENLAQERNAYFNVIKAAITAAVSGSNPIMAAENGRRAIPLDVRPTFDEMENIVRKR